MQLVGTPGIGLLAQVIERHYQQAIQADTQQQGEQPGITPLVITRQNTR
jgi:hypothetical protein